MVEFNKKKSYKKVIHSPFFLLLLLLILLLLLKAVWGVSKKEKISAERLRTEQEQLSVATERQKELAKSVEYLKTEKGIEAEIRSKFRVVREGESVAVILDNDANRAKEITSPVARSWWDNVLYFLHIK